MKKNFLLVIAGLVFSIFALLLIYTGIDIKSAFNAISNIQLRLIILLLLLYSSGLMLRTLRWKLLISLRTQLHLWGAFQALVIGFFLNNILPIKLGELGRVEYLKKKFGISRSFLFGTILVERLLDLIFVILLFVFSVFFSETIRAIFIKNRLIVISLATIVVMVVLVIYRFDLFNSAIRFIPDRFQRSITGVVKKFREAFLILNRLDLVLLVVIATVLIWLISLLISYFVAQSFNISIPWYGYMFVVSIGILGFLIPSTSGGIGVYHSVAVAALLVFHVSPEKALAYSIVTHALDFVPALIIGIFILGFGTGITYIRLQKDMFNRY